MEARSPELGVKYKDLLLMGQLLQQGADLHQPRHALYYLYFADRARPRSAPWTAAPPAIPVRSASRSRSTPASGRWCASARTR